MAEIVWVFDCDGVLLDSNAMKSDGFAAAIAAYPASAIVPFLAYQRTAFGTSRFRLFQSFFDTYLGRPPAEGELEGLLEAFGAYCTEAYPRQPVTPGTVALLDDLRARGVTLYVASGSAEDELRAALAQIGIADRFAGIYGSPTPKKDILQMLRDRHPAAQMRMFGDARADYDAARAVDLPFTYVSAFAADPEGMANLQAQEAFHAVATLQDLDFAPLLEDQP